MDKFHFGENLRKVRMSKGISQEAIAYYLIISQKSYSRIEHKENFADLEEISRIAEGLGVETAKLLPPLIEIDQSVNQSSNKPVWEHKAKEFLSTRIGKIVLFGAALMLVISAHDITQEIFFVTDVSQNTMVFAKWAAAFAMGAYIWYWVWRIKRGK